MDKLIRASNMVCPITGKTLKERDLIPLQRVRFIPCLKNVLYYNDTHREERDMLEVVLN